MRIKCHRKSALRKRTPILRTEKITAKITATTEKTIKHTMIYKVVLHALNSIIMMMMMMMMLHNLS